MQHFTGLEYLKIDIANGFGLDKESWDSRIDWTTQNLPYLEDYVDQADEPMLYLKAVNALRKDVGCNCIRTTDNGSIIWL